MFKLVILMLLVNSGLLYAQKSYDAPETKKKRGLMEEGEAPKEEITKSETIPAPAPTPAPVQGQDPNKVQACECKKLVSLFTLRHEKAEELKGKGSLDSEAYWEQHREFESAQEDLKKLYGKFELEESEFNCDLTTITNMRGSKLSVFKAAITESKKVCAFNILLQP